MGKRLFILSLFSFLCIQINLAQNTGIFPLTGFQYYNEGIWAKAIGVKMDGAYLLNNRIPLSKPIEINLQQPSGFTEDKSKKIFAAAEFILESEKGKLISKKDNLLLQNETSGFAPKDLKSFSITFDIAEGLIQPNSKCVVKIRLYDLKGKNQLRLVIPLSISYPRENIHVSKTVNTILAPSGSRGLITGMKAKSMKFSVDTTVKMNPKMAYINMDILNIDGGTLMGMFDGKESFWIYDINYNQILVKEQVLKQVNVIFGKNSVNYNVKIPLCLKTDPFKGYTIRFRWESPDKQQVIDVVAAN